MIKKLVGILSRVFISSFIALLSISIIILTFLLILTNHKILLKYFAGINVEHDCHFTEGNFVCSYYYSHWASENHFQNRRFINFSIYSRYAKFYCYGACSYLCQHEVKLYCVYSCWLCLSCFKHRVFLAKNNQKKNQGKNCHLDGYALWLQ